MYVPIELYFQVFLSAELVDKKTTQTNNNVYFKASGPVNNRDIEITNDFIDDKARVAQREIINIKQKKNTADLQLRSYRRIDYIFRSGKLKERSSNLAINLKIDHSGLNLYYDNHNQPLGKVVTTQALRQAAADTSTRSLREACEIECR